MKNIYIHSNKVLLLTELFEAFEIYYGSLTTTIILSFPILFLIVFKYL